MRPAVELLGQVDAPVVGSVLAGIRPSLTYTDSNPYRVSSPYPRRRPTAPAESAISDAAVSDNGADAPAAKPARSTRSE